MFNALIIPGNGNTKISENWFLYVNRELARLGIEVRARNMPDPDLARREYWLPFIKNELQADEHSVLIGHSSGAVAIMRYLEDNPAQGAILVGVCHTDLGSETERVSGYYTDPWRWADIRRHAKWIAQFASTDDPYIPIAEARFIHKNLQTEYYEYTDQGHFGRDKHKVEFPEIVAIVEKHLKLKHQ